MQVVRMERQWGGEVTPDDMYGQGAAPPHPAPVTGTMPAATSGSSRATADGGGKELRQLGAASKAAVDTRNGGYAADRRRAQVRAGCMLAAVTTYSVQRGAVGRRDLCSQQNVLAQGE